MNKVLLLALFTAGTLAADTASTICAVYGMTPVSGDYSCSQTGADGTAQASTDAFYGVGGNGIYAGFNQSDLVTFDNVNSLNNLIYNSASASESLSAELETPGPVRNGYLAVWISPPGYPDRYEGSANLSFDIGNFSGDCDIVDTYGCTVPESESFAVANDLIPFTLGESFLFDAAMTSEAGNVLSDGEAYFKIYGYLPIEARFFEADGTTPVPVDPAVREPASVGMVLLAVFVLVPIAFGKRSYQRRFRH